ncbi:MAG TPA: YggT family protein [Acidimicrobiales bacterium]|jgi:YggT family protein|nr:YggT family protein [Acidimicrobiales bacterium]
MSLICVALQLYVIVVFARVIFSWFPVTPGSALEGVYDVLQMLTEPVLGPLRRALPPVRLGGMGLDLSPLIALLGIQVLQRIICS